MLVKMFKLSLKYIYTNQLDTTEGVPHPMGHSVAAIQKVGRTNIL
jgi:hypothetical protein